MRIFHWFNRLKTSGSKGKKTMRKAHDGRFLLHWASWAFWRAWAFWPPITIRDWRSYFSVLTVPGFPAGAGAPARLLGEGSRSYPAEEVLWPPRTFRISGISGEQAPGFGRFCLPGDSGGLATRPMVSPIAGAGGLEESSLRVGCYPWLPKKNPDTIQTEQTLSRPLRICDGVPAQRLTDFCLPVAVLWI